MAIRGGPDVIEEGLILAYDAANPLCFRGEPTTNLMPHTNGITGRVGWPGGAYTHSIETTGDYAGWEKMVVTSTGSISNFIMRLGDVTCSPGVVYTATIEYYAPYANLKFNISGAHGNYSPVRIGDTNQYYLTFTFGAASAGGMGWWLLTTASTPANTAIANGVIYYRRVQFEQKPYYTDFTIGTRGSTVASGGGLIDLTGNGNDGEIIRAASPSNSFYDGDGKGNLSFNGSNDYVSISHSLDLNNTYTFVTFFKFDSFVAANPRIFEIRDTTYSLQLIRDNASSTISTWSSRINSTTTTARRWFTPSINIWYHVTTIFTTTATYLYLNGVELTSPSTTNIGPGNQNNKIILGVRSDNQSTTWLDGNIATFSIYNIALSAEQIEQNYNATKGRYGL